MPSKRTTRSSRKSTSSTSPSGDEPAANPENVSRQREVLGSHGIRGKKAWPTYRSATGVTSMQKENVVEWARKHVKSAADINEIVEEFELPGCRLGQLLAANHLPMEIDVLQVDAEGEDDSVIYCCDLEMTRPTILFFENKNLSAERLARLLDYLWSLRYEVFHLKRDTLAIRSGR